MVYLALVVPKPKKNQMTPVWLCCGLFGFGGEALFQNQKKSNDPGVVVVWCGCGVVFLLIIIPP